MWPLPLDTPSIDNASLLSILGFHFSAPLAARLARFFHFSSLFRKIAIDNKTNKTIFPYSFYSVFSLYTLFLCLIVYIYLKNIVIPTVCGIDNDYRQCIDNEILCLYSVMPRLHSHTPCWQDHYGFFDFADGCGTNPPESSMPLTCPRYGQIMPRM